jgi:predicted dehydrogenase
MHFNNKTMAIVHVSWLDPNKSRIMTIVGDKKMAVYNDIEPLEKIKIYNKGVDGPRYSDNFGEFHYSYRYGDTWSPMIQEVEPLKTECLHFLECIKTGKKPLTDGQNGFDVVRVLHAADLSLQNGGGRVQLENISAVQKSQVSLMAG